ncbi:MAG TPA: Uma2 family endonuclease [Thermoanaerobaculia bacterium]|jgi:Uma2 family endonuclease|nr:Uma2 family endonuclease [Thermoanaerobaculia bacterium]
MAPQTTTRLTYEDFVKLPDDGNRYEIIEGKLYVNPAPVPRHQRIVKNLLLSLELYFRAHHNGEVLQSPIDVVLAEDGIVEPDLIVIKSERASIVGEKNVKGAPNLVIEVLSDGTRRIDEGKKRKLYERSGVDEYWIVDPEAELVKIYRRVDAAFQHAAEFNADDGGTITTPLLPGFSLDVREVFA